MALGFGMLLAHTTDRQRFDSVIRHELAHLANRDIRRYYLSLALFRTVLVLGGGSVLAIVAALVVKGGVSLPAVVSVAWRSAVLLALSWLVLRGFLRHREFLADQLTARWLGEDRVRDALSWLKDEHSGVVSILRAAHPSVAKRAAALSDPRDAFSFKPVGALLCGTVSGVLAPPLVMIISMLGSGSWLEFHATDVAGGAAGALLATSVSVGAWRNSLLAGDQRGWLADSLTFGVMVGTGLLVGGLLDPRLALAEQGAGLVLSWRVIASTFLGLILLCLWIRVCVRLGVRSGGSQRAFRYIWLAAALLGAWLVAVVERISEAGRAVRLLSDGDSSDGFARLPASTSFDESEALRAAFAHTVTTQRIALTLVAALVVGVPLWLLRSRVSASAATTPTGTTEPLADLPDETGHTMAAPIESMAARPATLQRTIADTPKAPGVLWLAAALGLSAAAIGAAVGMRPELPALLTAVLAGVTISWLEARPSRAPAAVTVLALLLTGGLFVYAGTRTDDPRAAPMTLIVLAAGALWSFIGPQLFNNRLMVPMLAAPLAWLGVWWLTASVPVIVTTAFITSAAVASRGGSKDAGQTAGMVTGTLLTIAGGALLSG